MVDSPKSLRLFVALVLPQELLDELRGIQRDLERFAGDQLRFVRPEGIHLTLKFLGDVEQDRVPGVERALAEAVRPFELRVRPVKLGGFGGRRLRVVWVGVDGSLEEMTHLAERIDEALAEVGFEQETRPFTPHLTLARLRDRADNGERARIAEYVTSYEMPELPEMIVSSVLLISSVLGPGGARYRTISSFPARTS